MFEQVAHLVGGLREVVGEVGPRCLRVECAARLLALFAEAERLAGVGKALMARRVEETSLHAREGLPSVAAYVAATTGTSVGAAVRELQTARRLERLPAASEAWRAGSLSGAQAAEIASAASAVPAAEQELVAAAARPLPELAARCRQVRGARCRRRRGGPPPRPAPLPVPEALDRPRRRLPPRRPPQPRSRGGGVGRAGALRGPGGGAGRAPRGPRRRRPGGHGQGGGTGRGRKRASRHGERAGRRPGPRAGPRRGRRDL